MAWRIGVDSGGTFTDVCLFEESTGDIAVSKVSSTPTDPSRAVADEVGGHSPMAISVAASGRPTPVRARRRQRPTHMRRSSRETDHGANRDDNQRGLRHIFSVPNSTGSSSASYDRKPGKHSSVVHSKGLSSSRIEKPSVAPGKKGALSAMKPIRPEVTERPTL